MANLQRIQERIDMLPSFIKEVEELHPIAIDGPVLMESSFDADKVQVLKDKLSLWKAVTSEIISIAGFKRYPRIIISRSWQYGTFVFVTCLGTWLFFF